MGVHVDPIFLQKTKKSKFAGIIMYTTLIIGSDQIRIQIAWVWVQNGRLEVGIPGGYSSPAKVPKMEAWAPGVGRRWPPSLQPQYNKGGSDGHSAQSTDCFPSKFPAPALQRSPQSTVLVHLGRKVWTLASSVLEIRKAGSPFKSNPGDLVQI